VEFYQRIADIPRADLPPPPAPAPGNGPLLHAYRALPDAIAEDMFLLDAILGVALRQSPSFHQQWAATFMSTPQSKVHSATPRENITRLALE